MKDATKEKIEDYAFRATVTLGILLLAWAGIEFGDYLADHHEAMYGVEVELIDELQLEIFSGIFGGIIGGSASVLGYTELSKWFRKHSRG